MANIENPVQWVDALTEYWQNKQIDAIVDLFSDDCEYWETPFEKVVGIENIRQQWNKVMDIHDMHVHCNTMVGYNERIFAVFTLHFNAREQSIVNELKIKNGKCVFLKQWYMEK